MVMIGVPNEQANIQDMLKQVNMHLNSKARQKFLRAAHSNSDCPTARLLLISTHRSASRLRKRLSGNSFFYDLQMVINMPNEDERRCANGHDFTVTHPFSHPRF